MVPPTVATYFVLHYYTTLRITFLDVKGCVCMTRHVQIWKPDNCFLVDTVAFSAFYIDQDAPKYVLFFNDEEIRTQFVTVAK